MDHWWWDIRYGARTLLRDRGFTTVAVATLALGVGVNIAIFSVIRGVLLEPLPHPDPGALVRIWSTDTERGWTRSANSMQDYLDFRERGSSFADVGAYPGTFGKAAAQSVLAIHPGGDELLRAIDRAGKLDLDIYLDWGRLDHSNDATETDIPGFSRRLRDRLRERGYVVAGREWNDSSDVQIWAWRARPALRALFPR